MQDPQNPSITQIYRDRSVTFSTLIADDPAMRAVLDLAKKAARSDASILIVGETGTGKNLVAQAVHNDSPRANEPFVSANCAAFAETLLESELFGHERGAFTGADKQRKGVFEQADGGTLFLDEIGDLSLTAQAKILRAVEYKEFERLGGQQTLKTNIRMLFATNRDLREAVKQGEFREDLYYRVSEFTIEIPALRKRRGDIQALADRFLGEQRATFGFKVKGFTEAAQRALVAFDWPGNVRRLRAVIKRAAALADGDLVDVGDLDLSGPTRAPTATSATPSAPTAVATPDAIEDWNLATIERRHIEMVLAHAKGNKSEAARILDIARTTLDRKLASYGLDPTG
ncbi:MAG: sigma-54-dependent Fis family transcriptional regulator [Planctomycetes bacterium]|nr:sigma-54-dependent Fis family transcriptional regulator [Planctomycetota bacterium]